MFTPSLEFSRFDRAVLLLCLGLLLVAGLLLWRGDRVGVQVTAVYPPPDAGDVSASAGVQVVFSQEMAIGAGAPLTISPPVPGRVRWDGRIVAFVPDQPLQPGTTYTVTVANGLQSRQGRPFLHAYSWRFQTGQTRILYIAWDDQERSQIFVTNPDGREQRRLTEEPYDVLDFAVAPDGATIIYSSRREDGGSDLWLVDHDGANRRQVLDCAEAACTGPVWLPDGRRLVYERRNMSLAGAPPGPPRLWWLDVAQRQSVPVFQDSQWLGLGPRPSANGDWLAYVVPLEQEIQMYNVTDGRTLRVTSRMGQPPAWRPDQDWLLVNDILLDDDRYAVHIFLIDLATSELRNLSGEDADVNDNWPAWSPDGRWIAFGRRIPRVPMGSQLWLMAADGTEVRPLTDEPEVNYGAPKWSPDGQKLLFERFVLAQPGTDPGIWLLDVASGALFQVVPEGIQPAWLP
jgi:Tol biopolymer transport system component